MTMLACYWGSKRQAGLAATWLLLLMVPLVSLADGRAGAERDFQQLMATLSQQQQDASYAFQRLAKAGLYLQVTAAQPLHIAHIRSGSSAERAGLQAGESLLAVNRLNVRGASLEGALSQLGRQLQQSTQRSLTVITQRNGQRVTSELTSVAKGRRYSTQPKVVVDERLQQRQAVDEAIAEVGAFLPNDGLLLRDGNAEIFLPGANRRSPQVSLVALNPQLSPYFQVDQGVLVLSVPADSHHPLSRYPLQAGDVIQRVADRPVIEPTEVLALLPRLAPDTVVEVVRQGRTQQLRPE